MGPFRGRDDLRPEMLQHQFGMVAAGLGLDHGGDPGAASPANSTADLIWAEATGVRYRIGSGSRAPCSVSGSRPPSPLATTLRAHQFQGIEHPPHRPGAQRASPSKTAAIGQPATAPITSRQPVPELPKSSGACGSANPADADTAHDPREIACPLHLGAQRLHRFGGIEHVFALEQARYPGFADRQRAQDQGAVRNRLVAGNTYFSGEGAAGAGFKRGRLVRLGQDCVLCAAAGTTRPALRHANVGMRAKRY